MLLKNKELQIDTGPEIFFQSIICSDEEMTTMQLCHVSETNNITSRHPFRRRYILGGTVK